eukprot:GHVU01215187.1.p1 GENE.GHVU01215187.1~~GHVU01215187.1.p1  ORF type:complete len:511 (-),score=75.74 GHVU01215187.1:178-1710(-)
MNAPSPALNTELLEWLASVADDPYAFTMGAYPWGVAGTSLEDYPEGPDEWSCWLFEQIRLGLLDIEEAIQIAIASGHGIGKSATVSWVIMWGFCTYPDCRGVVTANTETQLKTKTWAELGKWFNLCFFARDLFILNATSLISKDPTRERTWRLDMIPWSEKNTEAFAGLHNKGKRLLLIMDEASAIPDIIHEVAEGALTDAGTQIIWLMCGNPTRNSGRFKEAFAGGKHAEFWKSRQIDFRTVRVTNKSRFEKWIKVYGIDSDFVRVRVLGQFPRIGEMEFFSAADIDAAMSPDREVFVDAFTPLALGVDVARFGANNSVIFPRKGRDARSLPRRVFNGLSTTALANEVHADYDRLRPDGIFIDGGGVGGGVVDQVRNQRLYCIEVQFGGKDIITGVVFDNQGERYANMRAAMYGAARAWLKSGMLPIDPDLRTAMLAIRYTFNKADEIQLVSKEDIMEDNPGISLDDLDAFVLTFGGPLARNLDAGGDHPHRPLVETEYDPYAPERMLA